MRIRPEKPGDERAIRDVVTAAFGKDDEARLVDVLREDGDLRFSLVAEDDGGQIVGHLALSPVVTERGDQGLGMAPVSVLPARQNEGFGSALVRHALDAARCCGAGWIVVLGDPAFYARFGFTPAPRAGLTDEYNGGDAFQVVAIDPDAVPHGAGTVHYAKAFETRTGEDA
jgi:putative acetyltransferase